MEYHEVANLFPMMTADEFAELKASIKANRQREPIYTHEGKIVDGRNRHKACIELGIKPRFTAWNENGSLVQFVIDMNLHRRQLSASQRAMIGQAAMPLLQAEAKKRMAAGGVSAGRGRPHKKGVMVSSHPIKITPKSRTVAGKAVGVGGAIIQKAKLIAEHSPKLAEEVMQGRKTVNQANRELRESGLIPTQKPKEKNNRDQWDDEIESYARTVMMLISRAPDGPWFDQNAKDVLQVKLKETANWIRLYKSNSQCSKCKSDGCDDCKNQGFIVT